MVGLFAKNRGDLKNCFTYSINNAPKRDDTENRHVIYGKSLVKSSCLHYWECASAHRRVALHCITENMQLAEGVIKKLTSVLLLFCFP